MRPRDAPLLPQAHCAGAVDDVARALLGQVLRHGAVWLRITEVEAYAGLEDSASHARMGVTPRNRPMWGPPGHAYVYLVYGLHSMVNVTAEPDGAGAAVLIRAAEPLAGHDVVAARRGGRRGPDALNGPGKVAAALAATVDDSATPLFRAGGLELRAGPPPAAIRAGPRVGIDYASPDDRAALRRFALPDTAWVSHPGRLGPPTPSTALGTAARPVRASGQG